MSAYTGSFTKLSKCDNVCIHGTNSTPCNRQYASKSLISSCVYPPRIYPKNDSSSIRYKSSMHNSSKLYPIFSNISTSFFTVVGFITPLLAQHTSAPNLFSDIFSSSETKASPFWQNLADRGSYKQTNRYLTAKNSLSVTLFVYVNIIPRVKFRL